MCWAWSNLLSHLKILPKFEDYNFKEDISWHDEISVTKHNEISIKKNKSYLKEIRVWFDEISINKEK